MVVAGIVSGVEHRREHSVTEEFSGGFLEVGKEQQLRPLQQLSSSSSSESLDGGGTQSWCTGGVGNGGWQAKLGQEGVSTHAFDPGKSEGATIMLIHREGRRSTAVLEMSVKENEYVVEHEEQGDGSSSSTSSSKSLDER